MLALADPDLDHGPRTDKSATMRMCAVSREVRPIDELIRFVVAPSGDVIPDLKRKLVIGDYRVLYEKKKWLL